MKRQGVSDSTQRVWRRLGKDAENRLSKCANKRYSDKKIIPTEYFTDKDNREYLLNILRTAINYDVKAVIYTLALNLLAEHHLILLMLDGSYKCYNIYLEEVLNSFRQTVIPQILCVEIPPEEFDFLGIVYQSLLKEGSKNINGSYYTPKSMILEILKNISPDTEFLDPCCGTGSFLLAASVKIQNPNNLYGIDKDEIACFISKINLIIRFKDIKFKPNIFNGDYLKDSQFSSKKFDMIATNPPWGALNSESYGEKFPEIYSGESFSYFIVKSKKLLNKNGRAVFILPQSVLNVAAHRDIRRFILKYFNIERIVLLGRAFSGVMSKVVILDLNTAGARRNVKIYTRAGCMEVNQDIYGHDENCNFSILSNEDYKILEKIYSVPHKTLKDSTFALGIVTGDNDKYVISTSKRGYEKIYTGKEVEAYFLKPPKKYIKYERKNFQQAAGDEIYRAKEKLVYKFISAVPVFAYDNSGALFLNSANILIPKIKGYSAKAVLAFLNSTLFKYIYMKKFNDLKMLKSNLLRLPFPILKIEDAEHFTELADLYSETKSPQVLKITDDFVYKSFGLKPEEISVIEAFCA